MDEEVVIEAIVQLANILLIDCMDDGEVEEEQINGREVGQWVKIGVDVNAFRTLPDLTFKMHFRMVKGVFEELLPCIVNHLVSKRRMHRLRTRPDIAVLMALWILGNPDTFRSTALHFQVSPGVVHFHYLIIIEALTEMSETFIKWPSPLQRQRIKENIERKYGFPGVIGLIDSTHLYITAPSEDSVGYINRHHSHSIIAQAVCDENMLITDLYVGEPGSLHDSRVFRRSPLSSQLLTNPDFLNEDEHILGDGGYILTDKLLVPFRNNGHLTDAQTYFNFMLSRVRAKIEQTFGYAKGLWRRMKNFESHCIEYAVEHVVASFVLHNFVVLHNNMIPEDLDVDHMRYGGNCVLEGEDLDPEGDYPNVEVEADHPLLAAAKAAGTLKRRLLAHYFQYGEIPGPNDL